MTLRRLGFLVPILLSAAIPAIAQNTVHTGARLVVPDGTLYTDNTLGPSVRWFSTNVHAGHSYVVEAFNSDDGLPTNAIQIALYENDGSTNFSVANTSGCGGATAGPSLSGSTDQVSDGTRCFLSPGIAGFPFRVVKIKASQADQGPPATGAACQSCKFRIRIRETTILSRWSVNGYNMFVAIHNPDNFFALTATVLYYPDNPVDANDFVASDTITLTRFGTIQFVRNSLSLTPNHGSLHILIQGVDADVQTYAYSTTAGTFNVFTPFRPNHGAANTVN